MDIFQVPDPRPLINCKTNIFILLQRSIILADLEVSSEEDCFYSTTDPEGGKSFSIPRKHPPLAPVKSRALIVCVCVCVAALMTSFHSKITEHPFHLMIFLWSSAYFLSCFIIHQLLGH